MRRLFGGALLTLMSAGIATPVHAAGDGAGWTFTDDLGVTVTLDEPPTRVAALSDVAYSLMNYGVEPVAIFGYSGITNDVRFDDLDTSGIAEVGAVYGEINLEALAAADPDLIVTNQYPVDQAGTIDESAPRYGFADTAQQAAVAEIAPIVTIAMRGTARDVIDRTTELSVALGASDGIVATAREDFATASADLASAGERGIEVVVLYAEPANVYVAKAPDDPSLRMYADLGVDLADPGGDDYYWSVLSWEQFPSIAADVVLYSERGLLPDDLAENAVFAATPAAAAGQVHPWVFAGMDYASSAAYMNELAGFLDTAEDVS